MRTAAKVPLQFLLPILLELVAHPLFALPARAIAPVPHQPPGAGPLPKPHPRLPAYAGMLQLRSGAHVAGFLPGKAYLVSRGHALTVEFLGTPGVMPRTLAEQRTTASEAYISQRVLYEDLWPGTSLTFYRILRPSRSQVVRIDSKAPFHPALIPIHTQEGAS